MCTLGWTFEKGDIIGLKNVLLAILAQCKVLKLLFIYQYQYIVTECVTNL